MNSQKETLATRIKSAQKKGNIGWLEIISIIFDNENTLLLTVISVVSSTVVCAIAYLYQRILLSCWVIPIELIGSTKSEPVIYYIAFGMLYSVATIINQIILRYVSLNTCVVLNVYTVVKRAIRVAKRDAKKTIKNKEKRKEYIRALTERKKRIKVKIGTTAFRAMMKELLITSVSIIPLSIMFQITSVGVSVFSLNIVIIVALTAVIGGLAQASLLLPPDIKSIVKQSKHIQKDSLSEAVDILEKISAAAEQWQKHRKTDAKKSTLAKMWNTVSRVDLYSSAISVFLMSLFPLALATTMPAQQKSFWIFEDAEQRQTYAAVYFKEDKAVLKEITINKDTAFIHLHKQVYGTCEGKDLIYKEFSQTILDNGALDRLEQAILRE